MSYLLDTHALIWRAGHGPQPSPRASAALESTEDDLVVSAVSAFEIATKVRLGKLDEARELNDRWSASLTTLGARTLDLSETHALLAGRLDWAHKDPFDRLLAAQAISEGMTLVTADPAFDSAPGLSLLPW